ncbi:uncharacterized protein ASCRUDRAFT_7973 [Ascoidea rubescens DSM 1968]|uniref:Uncharacterized protein n=1 Tax=Ascoidea rubescens DSM 1968 TaxID=1344418 RepID=A0A1D2VHG8_9ASCO|nr:hypothetical protein ASCRUDRAFT_7973 [Ascoidea rubescens DSM 1968]ODV61000.1 hypothetical protein ASCRUDRAFT_7973 [Ascoidea rubescens DSM 1968]
MPKLVNQTMIGDASDLCLKIGYIISANGYQVDTFNIGSLVATSQCRHEETNFFCIGPSFAAVKRRILFIDVDAHDAAGAIGESCPLLSMRTLNQQRLIQTIYQKISPKMDDEYSNVRSNEE